MPGTVETDINLTSASEAPTANGRYFCLPVSKLVELMRLKIQVHCARSGDNQIAVTWIIPPGGPNLVITKVVDRRDFDHGVRPRGIAQQ